MDNKQGPIFTWIISQFFIFDLGELMYTGVRAGGYANLPMPWRWGYGWKHIRGYGPLSQDEIAQAEMMYGQNLELLIKNIDQFSVR